MKNELVNTQEAGSATSKGKTVEVADATKRPWKVVDRRRAALPNIAITDTRDAIIAQVQGVHMRDKRVHGWTVAEANAADTLAISNAELIVRAVNSYDAFISAAKAALEYVDNLNEDAPVDSNCKECVGRVFFTKGTPEPPLCWIHQLEALLR